MYNLKKKMCLFMSAALLITAVSGCGGKNQESNGKVHIKWMNSAAINSDSEVEKYLEERYNVDIECISVTSNYTEKLGAMLASNEVPDVFLVNEPDTWLSLAKQGLIAPYDIKLVKEAAPDYYKAVMDFDENLFKISKLNDKYYAVPRLTGDEYNCSAIWRKDWLDNVGIKKVPETIEEFEEALVRFRENDPDGNGKKDTYGMSGMGNHLQRFFDMVFGAYGVMPGQWHVDENGKVTCDVISEKSKAALETLNRWYEKGIIHPEFVTDGTESINDKFNNGVIGVKYATALSFTKDTVAGRAFYDEWSKRNPKADFVLGPLPSGPDGDRGDWLWGNRSNFVCFGKQLQDKPETMKVILKILNDLMFDEEVAVKAYYGEKDVTYEMNEDGATYINEYAESADKRNEYGLGVFFNMLRPLVSWSVPEIANKYTSKKLVEFLEKNCIYGKQKDDLLRPVLNSSSIYAADLDKLRLTAYTEFIKGERSLETWNDFVSEYMEKGGKVILDEAQEYYDTTLK